MKAKPATEIGILTIVLLAIIFGCGKEKTPSRDQIPLIKQRISQLQEGVLQKSQAAIDSLLSVEILKKNLSSDSLLKFVYGPIGEYPFQSFGQPEIVYTDQFARVESNLDDSLQRTERPVTFMFTNDDGRWLLIDFKTGHSDTTK
jgi:hypothetical protein